MSEKYFENFWDCPNCATKNISALRKMRCPNCGRSKTTQDFENSRMVEITDDYGLKLAKSGKNWECSYCHSVNLDNSQRCQGCHADRSEEIDGAFRVEDVTEKVKNYTIVDANSTSDRTQNNTQESANSTPDKNYYDTRENSSKKRVKKPESTKQVMQTICVESEQKQGLFAAAVFKRRPSKEQWIAIGVIALVLIVSGLVYMTKCSYPGTLDSFYWERSVEVQIYKTLRDDGWDHPHDAYNINSYSKFHHNEPIYETQMVSEQESYTVTTYVSETTYESQGNGSTRAVTRQVPQHETKYRTVTKPKQVKVGDKPIYRTYYEYNVNRWVYHDRLHSSGRDKDNIYWHNFVPQQGGRDNLGATRLGTRNQSLYVYVRWKVKEESKYDKFEVNGYNGLLVGDKLQVHYLLGVPTGIKFDLKAEMPN